MSVREAGITYEELRRRFRWELPPDLNMGVACADRHPPSEPALIEVTRDGERREYTFGDLSELSNRLANALRALGVREGDRVGIVMPQRAETGLAHLALYKLGAIAVPMSILFGPQALGYRLSDCEASAVITDEGSVERVAEAADELGGIELVVCSEEATAPHHAFWRLVRDASPVFAPVKTGPDTPALLIYTSGTTGTPKGALHGHRVLLGHLPGFELSHDFFPQPGDRFFTPADWAWIGGLMDALMPAWYHGVAVVSGSRERFDPEWAIRLVEENGVRNVFFPPTVLKMMREAGISGTSRLRSVMSGGEPLGEEMLAWARQRLGVTVNEIYGQTECNYVVGNSSKVWEVRPGAMGRPYPGHDVVVLGDDGNPAPAGEVGEVAVRTPDPVMFLEYFRNPEATRSKHTPDGRWLLTGDRARVDEDGYLWYQARSDDVINSAGYRIGPGEIEECLIVHPAVAMAAAIGVPDPVRGEVVKAFVKLAEGHTASPTLEDEIRALVRGRLAAYEYPRHIEFIEQLPMTTSGKIRRLDLRRMAEERRRPGEGSPPGEG